MRAECMYIHTCSILWMMSGRGMKLLIAFRTFIVSSFSAKQHTHTHTKILTLILLLLMLLCVSVWCVCACVPSEVWIALGCVCVCVCVVYLLKCGQSWVLSVVSEEPSWPPAEETTTPAGETVTMVTTTTTTWRRRLPRLQPQKHLEERQLQQPQKHLDVRCYHGYNNHHNTWR